MGAFTYIVFVLFTLLGIASSRTIVITVGGNSTDNSEGTFEPPTITAVAGDTVYFNFTQGNHTVTQSVFAAPCMRAHDFNQTMNGFDSGFRDAGNFQAITNLQIPIRDNSTTIWFFDWNTCAQGGVGGINLNDSSLETYDGFVRNAMRLNGTDADQTSPSSTVSRTNAPSTPTSSSSSNDATRVIKMGTTAVVPLVLGGLALLF